MSRTIGIAGIQLGPTPDDIDETWARAARLIRQTVASWPWINLVVLPELSLHAVASFAPRTTGLGIAGRAEPIPGPTTARACELAAALGVWLVPGTIYERDGDQIRNTAVVISPDGEIVACYRKMFPWEPLETSDPGSEPCIFEIPGVGVFGLCVCYDTWFPEVSRALFARGAEVILHPSLTATWDRELELVIARATAIFNQCYFLDVNSANAVGGGRSTLIGPEGDVLHQAQAGEEVFARQLDLGAVTRVRENGTLGLNRLQRGLPRALEVAAVARERLQREESEGLALPR